MSFYDQFMTVAAWPLLPQPFSPPQLLLLLLCDYFATIELHRDWAGMEGRACGRCWYWLREIPGLKQPLASKKNDVGLKIIRLC